MAMTSFRRFPLPLAAASAAMALALMGGCYMPGYWPGGSQATRGIHTFESTTDFPQTIQLTDTATKEIIWTVNVPIGQQLAIRFYDNHDLENAERPALMRWELMPRGTRWGELDNAMPVPDYDRRLLEVFYREGDVAPGLELGASR